MIFETPDCYDPNYQERRRTEASEKAALHCTNCGEIINDIFYWDICGDLLCEDCVNRTYRRNIEDLEV